MIEGDRVDMMITKRKKLWWTRAQHEITYQTREGSNPSEGIRY